MSSMTHTQIYTLQHLRSQQDVVPDTHTHTYAHTYTPRSVSAPSMMPSTPSSTALATSVASARVGRGVLTMVSTTRVRMTGLPTKLQDCMYARADSFTVNKVCVECVEG
eukprot:1160244-Pelagomonas_calceolata.AAC.7